MINIDKSNPSAAEAASSANSASAASAINTATTQKQEKSTRIATRRWWIKLFLQPLLFLACGALLVVGLGVAQRFGFISSGGGSEHRQTTIGDSDTRYICPMMCTPPQAEPGRCPVCAMELVPAASGGGNSDARSIRLDPAARRIANIRTVAVTSMPTTRTIRTIGEVSYDEGTLKTISAYVDGRLERVYADFTGVFVDKGDHVALLYSPRLYSSQVEFVLAKKALDESRSSTLQRVTNSNRDLYQSSRQRLIELGMTEAQIERLEETGVAASRLHLAAPISGTVIEKMASEGQYVNEGQPIYKLADLSTVWLMLELFPDDAAAIHYGQKVVASISSFPDRQFSGRVAFVDKDVDPKTRTVGVRVVVPNEDGLLRVGDYAKAEIETPLANPSGRHHSVYDSELAGKWISPRHPHIIADSAGSCPICGIDLVPAAHFGFASQPVVGNEALVVPRDAVLMAGNNSVLYAETEPGRFEIRQVVLGPSCGDQIVIRSGVELGEQVATRGNFLIDSQMQLAGNPSLIDPSRLTPSVDVTTSPEMVAALSELSEEDRALVQEQRICPVAEHRLGSMGAPMKVDVNGTPVFICCEGCRERLLAEPDKYLAKLASLAHDTPTKGSSPANSQKMDLPPIGVPQLITPEDEEPEPIDDATTDGNSAGPPSKRVAEALKEVVR